MFLPMRRALAVAAFVPFGSFVSCGASSADPAPPPAASESPPPPPQVIDLPRGSDDAGCTPRGELAPPVAGLELVAHSTRGFSDTQGRCGWSYGYVAPATSDAFQLMEEYDVVDADWYVARGTYWTVMDGAHTHPNGTLTSRGRLPVEHWTVRRWTSNVSGVVRIIGEVRKSVGAVDGNGVVARVVVDGITLFEQTVVDETGIPVEVTASLAEGSTVDFVVDPHESDDAYDSTFFEAALWR
jgi:hypothetical protein